MTEQNNLRDSGGNNDTAGINEAAGTPVDAGGETGTPEYSGGGALMYTASEASGQQDSIHIADDVITQIIAIATGKIEGISLPSAGVGDGIAGFLGMKGPVRGIRIETDERDIAIDISITVEYGYRINEIARALQDEVRDDLTEMTGLNVSRVNIHVLSINTKGSKKDAAQMPQQAAPSQAQEPVQGQ